MCGNPQRKICTASLDNAPLIDGFVFSDSLPPWLVLSHNAPMINATDTASKLALFCHFSLAPRSPRVAFADHVATVLSLPAPCSTPRPAGSGRAQTLTRWLLPATANLIDKERTGPNSTIEPSLTVCAEPKDTRRRNHPFSTDAAARPLSRRSVGARRGRRRHFLPRKKRGWPEGRNRCAPTGERLRGDFLVARNSFRCSVPLIPTERANPSTQKRRNEFRPTSPRLPTPRDSRRAGRMAIIRVPVLSPSPVRLRQVTGQNVRSDHRLRPACVE